MQNGVGVRHYKVLGVVLVCVCVCDTFIQWFDWPTLALECMQAVSELLLDSQKKMLSDAVIQCKQLVRAYDTSKMLIGGDSIRKKGYKGMRRRSSILPDGGRKLSFESRSIPIFTS